MKQIKVLVGPIASGKSTYCKKLAKQGCLILNDDAIVNLLHADDYTLYDEKLKILYKSLENHIITMGLCLDRHIIVDRGLNISKRGRQRWISLAKAFDVPCNAILFKREAPAVHAQRRCEHDSRGRDYAYWLRVAELHDSQYELPTLEEGFDSLTEYHHEQAISNPVQTHPCGQTCSCS